MVSGKLRFSLLAFLLLLLALLLGPLLGIHNLVNNLLHLVGSNHGSRVQERVNLLLDAAEFCVQNCAVSGRYEVVPGGTIMIEIPLLRWHHFFAIIDNLEAFAARPKDRSPRRKRASILMVFFPVPILPGHLCMLLCR